MVSPVLVGMWPFMEPGQGKGEDSGWVIGSQ